MEVYKRVRTQAEALEVKKELEAKGYKVWDKYDHWSQSLASITMEADVVIVDDSDVYLKLIYLENNVKTPQKDALKRFDSTLVVLAGFGFAVVFSAIFALILGSGLLDSLCTFFTLGASLFVFSEMAKKIFEIIRQFRN